MVVVYIHDVYAVLSVIDLIACLIFGVFIFWKSDETLGRIMRLITSVIELIIHVFQVLIQIQIGNSYIITIFLIFGWFVSALSEADDLRKDD